MKKLAFGILLFYVIFGFSSFISASEYPDVPEGHWSYDAILQLARNGLVEGYPEGLFKGERPATRYEMALIVARVIAKVEQSQAQLEVKDQEIINKLIGEFKKELTALGVKVNNIEEVQKKHEEKITELERVKFYVDNHSFYVDNNVSGDGQANATTLDMSLFEWGLGNNNTVANGSIITRNASFAITRASAVTTNTKLGARAKMKENMTAGLDLEIYTRSGDATAGRVFGVQLPVGNYGDGNANGQPTATARLWNLWAEQKNGDFKYKAVLGSIIPDISKGERNLVRLGSFFIRSLVTSMSILGHQFGIDKKSNFTDISGRHPLFGFEVTGSYKNYDFTFFRGTTEQTPVTAAAFNDRQMTIGRIGAKFGKFGIGLEGTGAYGNNPAVPFWQGENLWGADASYKFTDHFSFYGALATSTYTRSDRTDVYNGTSDIVGFLANLSFLGKFFEKSTLKLEYQSIDKNYEPLNIHKSEHYPRNYAGFQGIWKLPVKGGEFSLTGYSLEQIDPDVSFTNYPARDAQNDYIFPGTAAANTEKGKIIILSPMIDYTISGTKLNVAGYYEVVSLRRGQDASGTYYYKRMNNLSLWVNYPFTDKFLFTAGFRNWDATGRWTVGGINYNISNNQTIPKVGFTYKVNPDIKATLLYDWYTFTDNSGAAAAFNNSWTNGQLLGEITLKF